ncbi:hypothetical protein C5167_002509 [Papaver somniferum]|uniref:Uncharacterized protein n=1 Tax=Papaver somniferum TaxID=3469 RepID=A0A4Y7KYA1_PAPSO|nr:uncharacterized protein LOC113313997 [Papaver somniferum]RZC78284.1 hypothetical protein C5167_002509 [Papaver somniferum]
MAASPKIHLFKKSAIEAGTPELYYLNPSENLWKITSMWRVVEHEDLLFLTLDLKAIGDLVSVHMDGKFINIEVKKENKENGAARFHHKDGMKKFSIEMNPHFLHLGIKVDDIKGWEGIARNYISKLTPIEIKRYAETKNDPKPKSEEKSKGPYTVTINVSRLN